MDYDSTESFVSVSGLVWHHKYNMATIAGTFVEFV